MSLPLFVYCAYMNATETLRVIHYAILSMLRLRHFTVCLRRQYGWNIECRFVISLHYGFISYAIVC